MENSISSYVKESFGVDASPGKKGVCPYCRKNTFSIKGDDSLGKCFHQSCGRFLTLKMLKRDEHTYIQNALQSIMSQCKAALQSRSPDTTTAYNYLTQERRVCDTVISDSYIGIMTPNVDIIGAFKEAVSYLESVLRRAAPDKKETVEKRIEAVEKSRDKLISMAKNSLGWLCFFCTDETLAITSIRFRKPYTKEFMSWVGEGTKGVFGLPLVAFSEDPGPLIVVEGEFNSLSLQTLAVQQPSPTGYLNVIAMGSASSPDFGPVQSISAMPLFVHDNDDAGVAVVSSALDKMHLRCCTTPAPSKDLDEYIQSFEGDKNKAWLHVQELFASAVIRFRNFEAIARDIARIRSLDEREFIIFNRVSDTVIADCRVRTRFLRDNSLGYLFDLERKRLIRVDKKAPDFASLISRYGLNQSERIYGFVHAALSTLVHDGGEYCEPRRFAHYCRNSNRLYISRGDQGLIRITSDSIEGVDNGTDGYLFLNDYADSMPLADGAVGSGHLEELLVSKINFADGDLTPEELGELFTVWLKGLFFASLLRTKPVIAFIGEKGSGKSLTIRRAGILLFGERFDVTPLPREPKDFDVLAATSHILAIDNADTRSDWLEDKIAIISTGGTLKGRKLYTDSEVVELRPQCFLALTARTPKFRRDDIADRLLVMPLKRISVFATEASLIDEILRARKQLLSELFSALQRILVTLADPNAPTYQGGLRMADFAEFALKVAYTEGRMDMMQGILNKLSAAQSQFTLELDSIAELLETWIAQPGNADRWVANKELFLELKKIAEETGDSFPYKNHRAFAQRMSNIRPNLKALFKIEERSSGARVIKFRFTAKDRSPDQEFMDKFF